MERQLKVKTYTYNRTIVDIYSCGMIRMRDERAALYSWVWVHFFKEVETFCHSEERMTSRMEKRKDAWVIDGNETYESQYNEYLDITIPNSKTMQFATMKTTTTSAEMAGLGVGQLKVTLMRKMTPPTMAMATTTTICWINSWMRWRWRNEIVKTHTNLTELWTRKIQSENYMMKYNEQMWYEMN